MGLVNIPLSGKSVSPLLQVAGTAGLSTIASLLGNNNQDSRIRLKPFNEQDMYGNGGILSPLKNTNGEYWAVRNNKRFGVITVVIVLAYVLKV